MKVLILGTGPVAAALAASLRPEHSAVLASRTPEPWSRVLCTERVLNRWSNRPAERNIRVIGLDEVLDEALDGVSDETSGAWDLVVSTAPPTAPEIGKLLGGVSAGTIAAVTQVPSEVGELERLADGRPWGLIVPGFLAWDAAPTRWWQVGPFLTVTDSLDGIVREALSRRSVRGSVPDVLKQAATMMPIVAGLHVAGFDLGAARRRARRLARASDEAHAAVALAHGLRRPRRVLPIAVWCALRGLPWAAPMNVSEYLRKHFGGHAPQTLTLLDDWIAGAREHGIATPVLEEFRGELTESMPRS